MAPHTGSATPEQIDTLLNFLDEHRDLARGRLRSVEGKVQAKRLWDELCNILNSMGGCMKTIQQWQKVWFDRKHLAKKAASDSRRSASLTGGGPSTATPLTQWELKVLSIMGDGFGERQTGARVPAFSETNEPIPSTSSQASQPPSQSPSFPQPLDLNVPEEVVEYMVVVGQDDSQRRQPTNPQPIGHSTSRRSTQPTQPTSQRRSDVRSRLFQLEEARAERETVRNNELAGIRAALLELCGLLRQFLDRTANL